MDFNALTVAANKFRAHFSSNKNRTGDHTLSFPKDICAPCSFNARCKLTVKSLKRHEGRAGQHSERRNTVGLKKICSDVRCRPSSRLRWEIRCLAPGFLLLPFTCDVTAPFCALSFSGVYFLDMLFKGRPEN